MKSTRSLPIFPGSELVTGAHHPHCERHREHLLWIAGRPLCLGCTCMAIGVGVGVALVSAGLTRLIVSLLPWLVLHTALVVPTALQPWIQRKPYKVAARTLLGVASATWLLACIGPTRSALPWPLEPLLIVVIFAALARTLWVVRERYSVSPCAACPLGAYPTCAWNMPRVLKQAVDPRLVEALLSLYPPQR